MKKLLLVLAFSLSALMAESGADIEMALQQLDKDFAAFYKELDSYLASGTSTMNGLNAYQVRLTTLKCRKDDLFTRIEIYEESLKLRKEDK